MIPFLSILSNPITKIVADKVIGGVKHSMEKKAIQRNAEIEAARSIDYAKIEAQKAIDKADAEVRKAQANGMNTSLKDEYLTIVFTILLGAHFFPQTQPHMVKGWELLQNAPNEFWYIILTIVAGSFGVNTLSKWKK
jgi:hypothetical protein